METDGRQLEKDNAMTEYRIVEKTYNDGVKYQVQKTNAHNQWDSIIQVPTLQEARDVITERKNRVVVKERVVE